MVRKYGTINEEVNRIKSLFGESRLYGNLVEQEDSLSSEEVKKELNDMNISQKRITKRNNEYDQKIKVV